jgi:hypothetical protein
METPAPVFNGTEGAPIDLTTAATWTENYRNTYSGSGETKAVFIGKDIINNILRQEDCMGLRIYFAIDDNGEKNIIMVGADSAGTDQVTGIIADYGVKCPPVCDLGSNLCT